MKKCCIAIITHKQKLDGDDEKSFLQALKVFGNKRTIKLIIPENISTEYYDRYTSIIELHKLNNKYFQSAKTYNTLCCNTYFYDLFSEFDYVLIYQTDCWVFEDKLDYFMNLDYDWYGAPWPHLGNNVGNGGLSLRKVKKMLEITRNSSIENNLNGDAEDTWFCLKHKKEMKSCDLKTACNFSMELVTRDYLKMIDTYPMGFHSKDNLKQFWDENGEKFIKFKEDILKNGRHCLFVYR